MGDLPNPVRQLKSETVNSIRYSCVRTIFLRLTAVGVEFLGTFSNASQYASASVLRTALMIIALSRIHMM